ncbi:hypothetical protein Dsin_016107 [Dipteronia sinensis]|uniref:NAC domain-containing protein n=1 Tax=Dipteronia sinensis TaxID=43782 RepID=A0AAE0E569_9ROSI|nr:hypothetical protein Dsin_016107 [Dipteronia sinensis]
MVDFPISVECRFLPTDKELVSCYLFNKLFVTQTETEQPFHDLEKALVKQCDLYGSLEPWEIWSLYGGDHLEDGQALYFFARLKKASVNGSRICRRVGSGTWAGEDSGDRIMDAGNVVGFKKRFLYENHGSPHDGHWIMHEFAIDSSLLRQHQKPDDIVLCRMKRNLLSKKNKFKQYCNSEPSKHSKIDV